MNVPQYHLPAYAIAQEPVEPRHSSRLLVSLDPGWPPRHCRVLDLPEILEPGDLLVVNTSRVVAARLSLTKATGGRAEVLLLEPEDDSDGHDAEPCQWTALVRPGRRLPPGTVLSHGGQAVVVVGDDIGHGRRRVRLLAGDRRVVELLAAVGTVALPPYIHRPLADTERYQTTYADHPGSVAAPTAGLHLSREVLERCQARGAQVATVDLAVGLATFRPITADTVEEHVMHAERYRVPPETVAGIGSAQRVVAVGTTTVRALESWAASGRLTGRTDLFIRTGFRFQVVDLLLTNFHQPRSSLLVLLEAFCGPRWRELYQVALAEGYRFLSFGDAMLVGRSPA